MKNYLLGICFLVIAFILIWQQGTEQIEYADRQKETRSSSLSQDGSLDDNFSFVEQSSNIEESGSITDSFPFKSTPQLGEESLSEGLDTELSSISFSNHTGAIRTIQLHQSQRLSKAYEMEFPEEPFLGIAFEDDSGNLLKDQLSNPRGFRLLENSPDRVVYRWEALGNLQIDRIYERSSNDGYGLKHRTIFKSLRETPMVIERIRLYLGSSFQIPRMYNPFDQASTYLSVGSRN